MRRGRIVDGDGVLVFSRAVMPLGFFVRLRGLLGRPALADEEAWWFDTCRSVHGFGMTRPIDVVHVDAGGQIVHIRERLAPFCHSTCWRGRHVVELRAGAARRRCLAVGQKLSFIT